MRQADHDHYDRKSAIVQRRVFADSAIHRAELATMFDRAWLFVGPANWLALPGEFVTSPMGGQAAIAWRGLDGIVRVFANQCPYGHEALTAAPRGRAPVLRCACHGYDLSGDGAVAGLPTLSPIGEVTEYRGLVFANRNPQVPPLDEWFGEFGWYLEMFLPACGVEAVGADSFRWELAANWKLPVLSGCGDLHADSANMQDGVGPDGAQVGAGGGALAILRKERGARDDPREGFVPLIAALFPNLLFDADRHSLTVVHPIGPTRCAIHSYCIVPADLPDDARNAARRRFQLHAGPAGLDSAHQAEQWQAVTAGAVRGRHRQQGLAYQMGLNRESTANLPGIFAPLVSEANQRRFFDWWQEQLAQPARQVSDYVRMGRNFSP